MKLQLVQTLHISDGIGIICSEYAYFTKNKIVAIGSDYACFSCNTRSWLKLIALYSGELNLAQKTPVAFEMVGVCFDCRGFR